MFAAADIEPDSTTRDQTPIDGLWRIAMTDRTPAIAAWAAALLGALEGRDVTVEATGARSLAARGFAADARALRPVAQVDLTRMVDAVDPLVLDALRSHPVAGPALRQLRD